MIKKRGAIVRIVPIIISLEINALPLVFQEFQCVKHCDPEWKDQLLSAIHGETFSKTVYDWGQFNLSLEKLELLFNKGIIEFSPQLNPSGRYRNIFERLIKEGQLVFSTNDEGYITLTRYGLPHNLLLQLLGAGYVTNRCIYYMRFIADPMANPEFEKLLLDPKCKFYQ